MHNSSDSEILKYASFHSDLLFLSSVSRKIETTASNPFLLVLLVWTHNYFSIKKQPFWVILEILKSKCYGQEAILNNSDSRFFSCRSLTHKLINWASMRWPYKSAHNETMTWLDNDCENHHNNETRVYNTEGCTSFQNLISYNQNLIEYDSNI